MIPFCKDTFIYYVNLLYDGSYHLFIMTLYHMMLELSIKYEMIPRIEACIGFLSILPWYYHIIYYK